jgi:hypothetical protein
MLKYSACAAVAVGVAALTIWVPTASADPGDVGVCARLNGAPFYIPAEGYMPKPGEVITGPVTGGPCTDQPETDQPRDDNQKPDTPDIPSGDLNAKPLEGNYTATVTDGGQLAQPGSTKPVVFTPCGAGCTRMQMPPGTADLHLQSTTWSGTYSLEDVGTCTFTVDANTLDTTEQCPSFDLNVRYALTKNG